MSGRPTRARQDRPLPPALPAGLERCYCWDLRLPHVHVLADHRFINRPSPRPVAPR